MGLIWKSVEELNRPGYSWEIVDADKIQFENAFGQKTMVYFDNLGNLIVTTQGRLLIKPQAANMIYIEDTTL